MGEAEHGSKTRLLDAALAVIRTKGYTATRIEDICEAAALTKGSFFHHFKSKDELALAAVERWGAFASGVFAAAPYRDLPDPLDRLLGYVAFRKEILQGALPEYTCLVGTMVQELYATHPVIRDACERCIGEHAAMVEADIQEAIVKYGIAPEWDASSLALYTQAVIQGAFVLAKAKDGPGVAAACIDHLRRYLELLFMDSKERKKPHRIRGAARPAFDR